ncbi:MAG: flagellar biosynthetic protein FliR [Candidatus Pacebacteria bacterium]|nr:flagellar biosynthetic protein FliR [Candidatus Paceibacterota bacterium]
MNQILGQLLTANIFVLAMVFCRLGSAMILMPGIGESVIPARFRLLFGLVLTLVLAPVVAGQIPPLPPDVASLFLLLGGEIFVGLFIGTVMRIMMTALDVAATIMSDINGLASASIFNPLLSSQGSAIGVFLSGLALVLLFVTGLHEQIIRAMVDSYGLIVPGKLPPLGDFSQTVVEFTSRSFMLGFQLAAPTMVIITLMMVGLGVIARLVPQLQVFFVSQPLQIGAGLVILLVGLPTMMLTFMSALSEALTLLLQPR